MASRSSIENRLASLLSPMFVAICLHCLVCFVTWSTFNFVLVAWRAPAASRFLSSSVLLQMIYFDIDKSVNPLEDEDESLGNDELITLPSFPAYSVFFYWVCNQTYCSYNYGGTSQCYLSLQFQSLDKNLCHHYVNVWKPVCIKKKNAMFPPRYRLLCKRLYTNIWRAQVVTCIVYAAIWPVDFSWSVRMLRIQYYWLSLHDI